MMSGLIYTWSAVTTDDSEGISVKHHHNAYELLLILEGEIRMTIEDRSYHIRPGQLVIVSRLENHDLVPLKRPYRRIGISVDSNVPALLGINDTLSTVLFRRDEHFNHVIDVGDYPEILELIHQAGSETNSEHTYSNELLGCKVYELLIHLYRRRPDCFYAASGRSDKAVGAARQYIDRHYHENITVSDIARQHYSSVSHFISAFKNMTGYTPKKYILLCRLAQVRQLLVNSDASISEIAEKTGFDDAGSLIRCFRKTTGITPGQFRKMQLYEDGYISYT